MQKLLIILAGCVVLGACRAEAQSFPFPVVPGWTMAPEPRVYDANDLWDIIDGAADLYLEYAFIDLHIARYTTGDHREVKAELYRHRDAENAFGIYAAERSPEYNFITIGVQGYQQKSVLNFVVGEYYLRLSSYQSDSASRHDLRTIAEGIDKHLNRNASLPKNLGLFPTKGKQVNSEQFVAQNFLGYAFLRSVYTASYGGSTSFKAFIMEKRSGEEAGKTVNDYVSKIPAENIKQSGDDRFDIQDPNNGALTIAIEGRYVYGSLNCTDGTVNNEILTALKDNLSHR
jgi:hypothetical protein